MFNFRTLFLVLTVLLSPLFISLNSNAQLITNGSFETSDFTGWTVVEMVPNGGDWFVYSGTTAPLSPKTIELPPVGNFAAVTDQSDPSSQILFQDINVPANEETSCSLIYYYDNNADIFINGPDLSRNNGPNQQARIDIMDPSAPDFDIGAGVLENLFQTKPGDPNTLGYTTLEFDLSDFAGTTVRLRIAEVDNEGEFNFSIDDVNCSANRLITEVPTLSEWGLIAMAGVLGIVSFMVMRRKRVAE